MSNSTVVNRSASDAILVLNSAQKGVDMGMLEKRSYLFMLYLFWKY